nr:MAG TPA: hypothetical protein [Caudoviricetes sp.]
MTNETINEPQTNNEPKEPSENSAPEQVGGADDADYVFDAVDGVDAELAKNFDAGFAKYAKDAGIDKDGASKLRQSMLGALAEQAKTRQSEQKAYNDKCAAEIKEMFGAEYDARMNAVSSLIEKADGMPNGEFRKFFNGTGLMSDPTFIKFMDMIVRVMPSEGNFYGSKSRADSAEDIKAEIASLMSGEAYLDGTNSGHRDAVEKVYALRRRLAGEA